MYRVLGYGTVYCTQSGGVHIFSKHKSNMYTFVQPRGGVYIFPLNTKVPCILLYNKGGVPKGPKSQKYVQMCIHVCTFVT